ncbi:GNAT family N-acetyltransferase [Microbulbifer sp. JMSA004]|uniref:GNAT family N-acetyltransferase n=2 Tax=Microbulbifer TaxID=48073 RepID=UPI0024AE4E73|nr:GNAT family N-acetyltransferase [Microbulbifer sp. VAAF005]WHI45210.1 GNAT family N-acetyltransferase [Microbulbifer sp. VAAF005]
MYISVQLDDLSDGSINNLLEAHLREMYRHSPPGSVHALNPDELNDPMITFWGARIDGVLAGCAALKEIDPNLGEIKSMKTHPLFLRKGVARALIERILEEAKQRKYKEIKLETGRTEAFAPAIALYRRYGFDDCDPFSHYKNDPFSLFLGKKL